jgi:hypothetical protein
VLYPLLVLELTSCLQLQITICTIKMSPISYYFWFLIIFSAIPKKSQALVAYKSLEPINATEPLAGLKLQKDSIEESSNFSQGITICCRFNFKILSRSKVFWIKSGDLTIASEAGYTESFLFFWNMNWIMKEFESQKFRIWNTNRWHHICLSFNKNTSHVTFVKVRIFKYISDSVMMLCFDFCKICLIRMEF